MVQAIFLNRSVFSKVMYFAPCTRGTLLRKVCSLCRWVFRLLRRSVTQDTLLVILLRLFSLSLSLEYTHIIHPFFWKVFTKVITFCNQFVNKCEKSQKIYHFCSHAPARAIKTTRQSFLFTFSLYFFSLLFFFCYFSFYFSLFRFSFCFLFSVSFEKWQFSTPFSTYFSTYFPTSFPHSTFFKALLSKFYTTTKRAQRPPTLTEFLQNFNRYFTFT